MKGKKDVLEYFKKFYTDCNGEIELLETDRDPVFMNKKFQEFIKEKNIKHFDFKSDKYHHATAIVER